MPTLAPAQIEQIVEQIVTLLRQRERSVLAVSGFGKQFRDPIESVIVNTSQGDVSYANARQRGYSVCTVTADSFTTDFRIVATTAEPTSTVSTDHTDVVAAREPVTLPPDPTDPTDTTTTTAPQGSTPDAPGAVPVSGSASYTG